MWTQARSSHNHPVPSSNVKQVIVLEVAIRRMDSRTSELHDDNKACPKTWQSLIESERRTDEYNKSEL